MALAQPSFHFARDARAILTLWRAITARTSHRSTTAIPGCTSGTSGGDASPCDPPWRSESAASPHPRASRRRRAASPSACGETTSPNAEIVGVDINKKDVLGPRIHFERGDQSDSAFLQEVARKYGPFDVVIDDGSHIGRHIHASYTALWHAVRPGGTYVVEDLPVAYHRVYEGGHPGTVGTAVELIKAQVDNMIRRDEEVVGVVSFEPSVAAIHLYPEIVFFEKAAREQCSTSDLVNLRRTRDG